jgi:DNA-directed RNA polymerase specialized sigma24 family protein
MAKRTNQNPTYKLTPRQRAQIRTNVTRHGWTIAEAAARFGVSWTTAQYHAQKAAA